MSLPLVLVVSRATPSLNALRRKGHRVSILTSNFPWHGDSCHTQPPDSALFLNLALWADKTPGLHAILLQPYRLQIEFWLWRHLQHRAQAQLPRDRVLDVGQPEAYRRTWACAGGGVYQTFGGKGLDDDDTHPDREGDLLDRATLGDGWDVILCTEVLEHCEDPFKAVRHMHEALAPGGLLLATSPFTWPEHGCADYPDLWRFTADGWRRLLRPFGDQVQVLAAEWASERGRCAAELLRQAEVMGFRHQRLTPGYLVAALKADPRAACGPDGTPLVHFPGCQTHPGHDACATHYASLHGLQGDESAAARGEAAPTPDRSAADTPEDTPCQA